MKSLLATFFLVGLLLACSRSEPVLKEADTRPAMPAGLEAALAKAEKENKMVLLDFTGSDWCPPCMALQREVFAKQRWQDFAEAHLVFVEVDFPRGKELPPEETRNNEALREKFGVEAFPTLLLLHPDGKVVWENRGFPNGGLGGLLAELEQQEESFRQKTRNAKPAK